MDAPIQAGSRPAGAGRSGAARWRHPIASLVMGLLFAEESLGSAALAALRDAAERHPDDPHLQIALGEAELEEGRAVAAVRELEDVAHRWPELQPDFETPLGIAYLETGRPGAALPLLEAAILRDPTDAHARSHYALALEGIGKQRRAREQLDVLAKRNPELAAEVELWLGLRAQRAGESEEARQRLGRAIELDVDGSVRERAQRALASPSADASGLWASASAGVEYDSNATQESDRDLPGSPGHAQDGRSTLGADFWWRAPPLDRVPHLGFEAGYGASQSLHFSLDELDRQLHTPYLSASWQTGDRSALYLDGFFSYELLDDTGYRHGFGFQPSWAWQLGPRLGQLRPFLSYRSDFYRDAPERPSLERDGYALGSGIEHFLPLHFRPGSWFRTGFTFTRHETEGRRDSEGFGPAFDRDEWGGWADTSLALIERFRLDASVLLSHGRYDHRNAVDAASLTEPSQAAKRRDLGVYTWLGVSRPVTRLVEIEVGWGYRNRDSNVSAYRYDGHTVGVYAHLRSFQPSALWRRSE